jgi:hypothetical protein
MIVVCGGCLSVYLSILLELMHVGEAERERERFKPVL